MEFLALFVLGCLLVNISFACSASVTSSVCLHLVGQWNDCKQISRTQHLPYISCAPIENNTVSNESYCFGRGIGCFEARGNGSSETNLLYTSPLKTRQHVSLHLQPLFQIHERYTIIWSLYKLHQLIKLKFNIYW